MVRDPATAAKISFRLYGEMLQSIGLNTPDASRLVVQSRPYCLIVTREWMLVVPRSQEFFDGISLNALAYAGSLFVRDQEEFERLRFVGPMKALASVAVQGNVQT